MVGFRRCFFLFRFFLTSASVPTKMKGDGSLLRGIRSESKVPIRYATSSSPSSSADGSADARPGLVHQRRSLPSLCVAAPPFATNGVNRRHACRLSISIRVVRVVPIELRWVLPGFTVFYWVVLWFTGFYRVLLGFTGFYRVLLGFTGFTGFYGFYWVLLGFTGFYWICTGFTGFLLGFTGFTGLSFLFWGEAGVNW